MEREPVLVIERDKASGARVAGVLKRAGFTTLTAGNTADGIRSMYSERPGIVVIVNSFSRIDNGDAFLRFRQAAEAPILVIGDRDDAVEMLESGADAYLSVPFSQVELVARVRSMLARERNKRPLLL